MRNDGSTAYLSIHEVLEPVGFCLTRVKVLASESKRYVAMKLTNPPASMFSATIASLAVNEWTRERSVWGKGGVWSMGWATWAVVFRGLKTRWCFDARRNNCFASQPWWDQEDVQRIPELCFGPVNGSG